MDAHDRDLSTDVVVIGGGIAGLSTALTLSERDVDVVVLENSERLGGRAQSWTDSLTGDPVHIGPHVFMSEYPNVFALFDRLGTRDRIVWQKDHFITLATGRELTRMQASKLPPPLQFLPGLLSDKSMRAVDVCSNVAATLYAMQMTEEDVMRLDGINAYAFLRRLGVTRRHIDQFWSFASMAIMNVPVELCSAGALLRFYKRLISQRDYWFGFADRGLGDLFAPQAKREIERRGGRVLLESEVTEIMTDEAGAAVGVRLRDGRRVKARSTVAALPPSALRRVAPPEWIDAHRCFSDLVHFQPSRYVSVFLWFDKKLTGMKMWARVHRSNDLNCDFYDLSNIHAGWRERPSVVASNIIYSNRAEHMSDDEIVAATRREIVENLGSAEGAQVVHAVVNRIPMAIHCPFPGTERKRPPTKTPVPGLFLAGDWVKTGLPSCMESAAYSGFRVSEQLLAERGVAAHLVQEHDRVEGLTALVHHAAHRSPTRHLRHVLRRARQLVDDRLSGVPA